MKLTKYVSRRLTLCEKWKLFILKRKFNRAMRRMDVCLKNMESFRKRACSFEDEMYAHDELYHDYVREMNIRYA